MGNKPSSTYRRVQPSLFHSFKYNRLSPSSCSESQQPLLVNNHDETVERLKCEIEENRKKNESLERRNVSLEKDMREFRAAILPKKEHSSNMEKRVAALEEQLLELKSIISKLQSSFSRPLIPGPSGTGPETTLLEKNIEKLENLLMKVEYDPFTSQEKQDTATGVQKNAELDKLLIDLAPTHQTKTTNPYEPDCLMTPMEQEHGNPSHDSTSDLVGCLLILMFLVTVLIGLNL